MGLSVIRIQDTAFDGRVVMMVHSDRVFSAHLWMPHPLASIPPSVTLLAARRVGVWQAFHAVRRRPPKKGEAGLFHD